MDIKFLNRFGITSSTQFFKFRNAECYYTKKVSNFDTFKYGDMRSISEKTELISTLKMMKTIENKKEKQKDENEKKLNQKMNKDGNVIHEHIPTHQQNQYV